MIFLSFLHNRTKYSTEMWPPYDNFILEKHLDTGSLALDYNSHSIILSGSAYGTLTQWKSEEAHRWASVGFPRAILILEAQAHLLSFLRSTVEKILGFTTGHFVESQISSFDEISKCDSTTLNRGCNYIPGTASCFLNRSFSAPPIFYIDSLVNIAKTREDLQGDHIRFLQTDNSYSRRYIELGMASNLKKSFEHYHKFILASSVQIIQNIVMFLSWGWNHWIVDEVENLKKFQSNLNGSLDLLKPSLKAYNVALGSLEALLLNQIRRRSKYLAALLPWYLREYNVTTLSDQHGTIFAYQQKFTSSRPEFSNGRLNFCLRLFLFDSLPDC